VHIPHRGLDGIVSGDIPQRKSVRIFPSLSQKRVAKSVKSGIRIGFDFITQLSHLRFQDPRLEFFVWMTELTEYVPALRFHDQLFEDIFGLCMDLQNALPSPPLQSALDEQVSPVAVLIGTLADEHAIFSRFSIRLA
jgi:hypothetical protein